MTFQTRLRAHVQKILTCLTCSMRITCQTFWRALRAICNLSTKHFGVLSVPYVVKKPNVTYVQYVQKITWLSTLHAIRTENVWRIIRAKQPKSKKLFENEGHETTWTMFLSIIEWISFKNHFTFIPREFTKERKLKRN